VDKFRFMDIVWMRDGDIIHTGEAVVLACLLSVKKKRAFKHEEDLKDILNVYQQA